VNSPLTDDLTDPIDDDALDTWVERTMFDDNTAPEIAAKVEPQAHSHPLHGWRPASQDQAEWAMARLVEIERELRKIRIDHDEWADRVEQSRRSATRGLEYRSRFFTEALRGYGITWREEAPDLRGTLHLPSGVVETTVPRKPVVQLVPARRGELVAWLREQDAKRVTAAKALKVPDPEPMISGVRKLVEVVADDGDWVVVDPATRKVVPGVQALPPGPTTATPKPHLP
jgi:hypothetical protein